MSGKRKLHSPDWYLIYEETEVERNRKKNTKLKQNYGLSLPDVMDMYKKQERKCKICLAEMCFENRGVHVDHEHSTGVVRGLLCRACNLLLGYAKDDITILNNSINYLKEFKNDHREDQFHG